MRPPQLAVLLFLIVIQLACAGFFAWDVVRDFLEAGRPHLPSFHLWMEAVSVVALAVAVGIEASMLRRLMRRQLYLQEISSQASKAMHDIVEERFSDWKLTPSEHDVAMLVVKGFSIAEIAGIRGNAEGTIKAHLNAIYRKSGTNSRAEMLGLLLDPLMGTALLKNGSLPRG